MITLINLCQIWTSTPPHQSNNLMDYIIHILQEGMLDSRINKTDIATRILYNIGGLYPATSTVESFTPIAIAFVKSRAWSWGKLLDTLELEYNVLDNYDRYEDSKRVNSGNDTKVDKRTNTSTSKETNSGNDNSHTDTSVSAYNTSTMQPQSHDETITNYGRIIDNTVTDNSSYDSDSTSINNDTYNSHVHGNIGVTTPAQMIEGERRSVIYDIYAVIIRELEDELFLGIY